MLITTTIVASQSPIAIPSLLISPARRSLLLHLALTELLTLELYSMKSSLFIFLATLILKVWGIVLKCKWHHSVILWPWASHLTSLLLSSIILNGVIISHRQDLWED